MTEDQSSQEQKQGFFNKAINGVNHGYGAYNKGRMMAGAGKQLGRKLGKKLGKQAVAQGARAAGTALMGATSEFWGPAALAIGVVGIAAVVFFIVLFGGASVTIGGDLGNNTSPVPTYSPNNPGSSVQPLPLDQVAKYLDITGATDAQKQIIYKMFSVPMGSSKYLSLLTGADGKRKIYIIFHYKKNDGTLSGGAGFDTSRPQIDAFGFWQVGFDDAMKAHWLIHESGHLIDRYNGRISSTSYDRESLIKSDPSCYNGYYSDDHNPGNGGTGKYYIKNYAFRDGDMDPETGKQIGGGADQESFAESLADYVGCGPGIACDLNDWRHSAPIKFNGQCGSTYKWFQDNIFNGDDFFATNTLTAAGSSTTDCNGKYASWFHKITTEADYQCTGKWADPKLKCAAFLHNAAPNFSDSACELTSSVTNISIAEKDLISQEIAKYDKVNVGKWMAIINCESHYHSHSFAPISTSGKGAYGLFQMNPKGRGNGEYDAGDVNWRQQIYNAINYRNNVINGSWNYWACGG